MSNEMNQIQIVNEFLKEVKSKLPGWLKDNKKELKEVISELESHIWEKAEEIASGIEPQIHHVQQAIQEMGNPRVIAAEYKKRGTPKIWISKELFPAYLKVFGIVAAIIVGINLISFIVDAIETGLSWDLFDYLGSIWSSALGAFIIVSVIFVALSMEGYLPEDFKKSDGKYQLKPMSSEQEDNLDVLDRKRQRTYLKSIKPPLKRGELLAGGIIIMLIGIAMISKVWELIPIVEDIGPQLTYYIQLSGGFTLASGFILLIQSMLDLTNYFAQRVLMILHIIVDVAMIPFILTLLVPAIMSVPGIAALSSTDVALYNNIELGFTVIKWIAVIGTIIGAVSNIYKVITLKMKFEEYLQFQES